MTVCILRRVYPQIYRYILPTRLSLRFCHTFLDSKNVLFMRT